MPLQEREYLNLEYPSVKDLHINSTRDQIFEGPFMTHQDLLMTPSERRLQRQLEMH